MRDKFDGDIVFLIIILSMCMFNMIRLILNLLIFLSYLLVLAMELFVFEHVYPCLGFANGCNRVDASKLGFKVEHWNMFTTSSEYFSFLCSVLQG